MYRHLLVPMDASELSTANCNEAIELAVKLGARVTFVHVVADYAATDEGALAYSMDPAFFAQQSKGQAAAILAKACVNAATRNVPHATFSAVSDRPAEAVLEAARQCGCDLIVMASHGMSGLRALLSRSHTRKVLEKAHVAVLVTHVQSNDPHAQAVRAIGMIQDEHRSLAAVVRGMQHLVEQARAGAPLDRRALQQMTRYIQAFPERLHHPHEERFLHPPLRRHGPATVALIERLEVEHVREHALVNALQLALDACPEGACGDSPAMVELDRRLGDFTQAVWRHLAAEETELLPLARSFLTEADWAEVARGFEDHREPRLGDVPAEAFADLFSAIASLLELPKAETVR